MFFKYLYNSVKNNHIWYLTIILCEIVLAVIMFCANGILLNTLSNYNDTSLSKYLSIELNEPLITSKSEDREKIDNFLSELPLAKEMLLHLDKNSRNNFEFITLFAFQSYDSMISYWSEERHADKSILPTREQYESGEKIAFLGSISDKPLRSADEDHILIGPNNDIYTVLGTVPGSKGVFISYGMEPENVGVKNLYITFKDIPTYQQISQINDLVNETFGLDNIYGLQLPDFQDLLDLRKNISNIILTALTLLLIVFNVALIFRQAVSRHKSEFAVFSFCGFSKKVSIIYSLAEMLILSALSVITALALFEYYIKPLLSQYYSAVSVLFTPEYYLILITAFMGVCALMFAICVVPIIKRDLISQLSNI